MDCMTLRAFMLFGLKYTYAISTYWSRGCHGRNSLVGFVCGVWHHFQQCFRYIVAVGFTRPSTWPWIDHPVSGLFHATRRPIKTRFPYASPTRLSLLHRNKSLTHYTKGTQSQNKSAPTACTHTVSGSISLPSPGFFSPFPHGTSSLSVNQEYLALEDGPPIFRQGFSCPALLDITI